MDSDMMEDVVNFTGVLNENCDLIICDINPLQLKANLIKACSKGLVKYWSVPQIEIYYNQIPGITTVPTTVKNKKQHMIDNILCYLYQQNYLYDYVLGQFVGEASQIRCYSNSKCLS